MSKHKSYKEAIIDYYDSSQWLYQLFVYNKKTLGMHFGFWDKGTKNRQEAIVNENQAIIDLAKIKSGQKVLDAGCGVGGSAIYIAKTTGTEVTGITLSGKQVEIALKNAQKHNVSHITDFQVQDFTKTSFPDNYFDVVYGIESICHAYPKSAFLKEAIRILKPGGRLVIADGYLAHKPQNSAEEKIIKDFVDNWALKELITNHEMINEIKTTGFVNTQKINKTKAIIPSVKYLNWLATLTFPITKLLSYIPISVFKKPYQNSIPLMCVAIAYKLDLASYFIHLAQKPQ